MRNGPCMLKVVLKLRTRLIFHPYSTAFSKSLSYIDLENLGPQKRPRSSFFESLLKKIIYKT